MSEDSSNESKKIKTKRNVRFCENFTHYFIDVKK